MFKIGMIHGRFQPFHIGHFDYLKRALELTSDYLIVGITNPNPKLTKSEATDNHRHLSLNNPFTFLERLQMIQTSVFATKGISREKATRIFIVPFPIHDESLWSFYVPKEAVQIMSVFEEWDFEKRKRFQMYGFKTYTLESQRIVSGTMVRTIFAENGNWQKLVPVGTRQVLERRKL